MNTRFVYDYVPHHRTKEKLEHGTRADHGERPAAARWCCGQVQRLVCRESDQRHWHHVMCVRHRRPHLCGELPQPGGARLVDIADLLAVVLLSVIIVGQNVLASAADKQAEATYIDADAI